MEIIIKANTQKKIEKAPYLYYIIPLNMYTFEMSSVKYNTKQYLD